MRSSRLPFLPSLVGSFSLLAASSQAALPDDCFLTSQLINYLGDDYPYTTDDRAIANLTSDHKLSQIRHCSSDSQVIGIQASYAVFNSIGRKVNERWMPPHGTVDDAFLTCESIQLSAAITVEAIAVFYSLSRITQVGILLSSQSLVEFGPNKGSSTTGAMFFGKGELEKYQFFGFSSQVFEDEVDTLGTLGLVAVEQACLGDYLDDRGPIDNGGNTDNGNNGGGTGGKDDSDTEEPEVPVVEDLNECFTTGLAINYLGQDLPVTTDLDKASELSANHQITAVQACADSSRMVGLQITYGIFNEDGGVDDEIKMPSHGTVGNPRLTCSTLKLRDGNPIAGLIINYSPSTITRVVFATADSKVKSYGPSTGSKNTGVIRFETGLEKDSFFGFTSQVQDEEELTLASLGLVSYSTECFFTFKSQIEDEKAEEEELARLEEERLAEIARLKAEQSGDSGSDDEGSGGTVAIVVIFLILIVGGILLFVFREKLKLAERFKQCKESPKVKACCLKMEPCMNKCRKKRNKQSRIGPGYDIDDSENENYGFQNHQKSDLPQVNSDESEAANIHQQFKEMPDQVNKDQSYEIRHQRLSASTVSHQDDRFEKKKKKKNKKSRRGTIDDDENINMIQGLAMINQKGGTEGMAQSFHLPGIATEPKPVFEGDASRNTLADADRTNVDRTQMITPAPTHTSNKKKDKGKERVDYQDSDNNPKDDILSLSDTHKHSERNAKEEISEPALKKLPISLVISPTSSDAQQFNLESHRGVADAGPAPIPIVEEPNETMCNEGQQKPQTAQQDAERTVVTQAGVTKLEVLVSNDSPTMKQDKLAYTKSDFYSGAKQQAETAVVAKQQAEPIVVEPIQPKIYDKFVGQNQSSMQPVQRVQRGKKKKRKRQAPAAETAAETEPVEQTIPAQEAPKEAAVEQVAPADEAVKVEVRPAEVVVPEKKAASEQKEEVLDCPEEPLPVRISVEPKARREKDTTSMHKSDVHFIDFQAMFLASKADSDEEDEDEEESEIEVQAAQAKNTTLEPSQEPQMQQEPVTKAPIEDEAKSIAQPAAEKLLLESIDVPKPSSPVLQEQVQSEMVQARAAETPREEVPPPKTEQKQSPQAKKEVPQQHTLQQESVEEDRNVSQGNLEPPSEESKKDSEEVDEDDDYI